MFPTPMTITLGPQLAPYYGPYLNSAAVTSKKIGSQSPWVITNYDIFNQFVSTGDWMRSKISNLETVIKFGIGTVLYDGDADYICNYMGFEAMVRASCFLLPVISGLCADPVTACSLCSDYFPKHGVLTFVRETEFCNLYGKG